MERERRLSLTVGLFFLMALLGFAVIVFSLSARTGVWERHYELTARFGDVQGLIASAPVLLAGKRVGQVKAVNFTSPDAAEPGLVVLMQINESVRDRIRSDSTVSVGSAGLLGDKVIDVTLGSTQGEPLAPGAEIPSVDPLDINDAMDKGARALENVATLASNLNDLVESFDQESGGKRLAASVGALGDLIGEVREGEGLLHTLIYEPYEGSAVENLEGSLASMDGILDEIATGNGLLHSLIYKKETEQGVVVEALEAGARLNSILAKIDRGEGTLGLILNDPTLYEELKILVGGANRSGVIRTMIRMLSNEDD
jgi:phospholipid/cholesterol/gamma-HCH transport system substrate-binding protein